MTEVDIIIPFHRNPDRVLLKAVDSAKNSTGVKPNLILVDDRSHVDTFTVIPQLKSFKIINSFGKGYAAALNAGILETSSEYVAILNSDDLQDQNRIGEQVRRMRNASINVSISKLTKFGSARPHFQLAGNQPTAGYSKNLLLLGPYGANASLVMKTDFAQSRIWDENCDMPDWKFAFNNYPEETILCSDESYLYRIHKRQISRRPISNYSWLYEEWQKRFSSLGGNTLSPRVIQSIALPNKKIILTNQEFYELRHFFKTMISHFEVLPESYYQETKSLLKRRLTIALAHAKNYQVLDLFDDIFSKSEILRDGLELGIKFVLNFDLARRI